MSSGAKKKSHSSRKETRSRGEDNTKWSEWSGWEWNDQKKCLMRTRTNANGDENYQYGQAAVAPSNEQPRTIPAPVPHLAQEGDTFQPVYSDSDYQNPGSYGFAPSVGQGGLNQGWNPTVGSGSQPNTQTFAQESLFRNDGYLPTGSGRFSGPSAPPYPLAPGQGLYTPTLVQNDPGMAYPALGRPPLPHSSISYPDPRNMNSDLHGYSSGHSNSFQGGQASNVPLQPGLQSTYPVNQVAHDFGRMGFLDAHGHSQSSSNQPVNTELGVHETDSPSRFRAETYPKEEVNTIENSDENTNEERIIRNVNKDYIEGGVEEGRDGRNFDKIQDASQELLKNKSIKIVTLNPKIKVDPMHKEYRVYDSSEFEKGRLFKMLWSEPYGGPGANLESLSAGTDEVFVKDAKYGEKVYSSIRRFAIVMKKKGHAVCVPILTYGKRGTAKPGVKPEYHAIIHSSEKAPSELNGEPQLFKSPIKVGLYNAREKLRLESRVNYSKIYTVEHNVKVCFIGEVHKDSKATFFADFERTFFEE